jgi:hemerythrin-like domain-containing protein
VTRLVRDRDRTVSFVERSGDWGSAGGLPVQDRPRAVGLTGKPAGNGPGNHRSLVQIHDHLRGELTQIRQAAIEVGAGVLPPAAARDLINRMTMRQNRWTLGSFCAAYCRVVTIHHTIEDTSMFPALAEAAPELDPVLQRLEAEHEVIADVLDRFDRALVLLVAESPADGVTAVPIPDGPAEIARLAAELSDLLLSHLAYEEDELAQGLGLLTGLI